MKHWAAITIGLSIFIIVGSVTFMIQHFNEPVWCFVMSLLIGMEAAMLALSIHDLAKSK